MLTGRREACAFPANFATSQLELPGALIFSIILVQRRRCKDISSYMHTLHRDADPTRVLEGTTQWWPHAHLDAGPKHVALLPPAAADSPT